MKITKRTMIYGDESRRIEGWANPIDNNCLYIEILFHNANVVIDGMLSTQNTSKRLLWVFLNKLVEDSYDDGKLLKQYFLPDRTHKEPNEPK